MPATRRRRPSSEWPVTAYNLHTSKFRLRPRPSRRWNRNGHFTSGNKESTGLLYRCRCVLKTARGSFAVARPSLNPRHLISEISSCAAVGCSVRPRRCGAGAEAAFQQVGSTRKVSDPRPLLEQALLCRPGYLLSTFTGKSAVSTSQKRPPPWLTQDCDVPKRPNHPPPDLERRNGKACLLAQAVQVLARANTIRELQFD